MAASSSALGSGAPRAADGPGAAVAGIVARVVTDHLDDARLDEVFRIGVDEVSYRKGHRYLTVVADHDRDGAVIGAGEGKSGATLHRFFDTLGSQRCQRVQAASADLHGAYTRVIAERTDAHRVPDPFHLIKLANAALDETRRTEWNTARKAAKIGRPSPLARVRQDPAAQLIKHTRWALLKDPDSWTEHQREQMAQLRRTRHVLFRAWVLKEELRDLYRLPPDGVPTLTSTPGSPTPAGPASRRCRPLAHRPQAPRTHPRRRRAWPVQQQARGHQLEDPTHQPPRLRPPQRRRGHRDDLPLLLRTDHHTAHRKVRRTPKLTQTHGPRRHPS